jgi:hypothetical protein
VRFAALCSKSNHSSSQPSPLRGEGAKPLPASHKPLTLLQYSLERHGVNASRSRSEVTPSKRWKTACLFTRVVIPQRGNRLSGGTSRLTPWSLEHVHSNSAQPRSHSNKKRRVPREARLRLPWSVWADAHGFELEFEFEFKDSKSSSELQPLKSDNQ